MVKKINEQSRRVFLKQASCAAIGGTTFLSTLLNLRTIGASSIFNSSAVSCAPYKAIVCLMFSGGNDSFNMLLPTTTSEYNDYAATRGSLAIPSQDIIPINAGNTGSRTFGVHPNMPKVANLFDSGKLSFISNIGSLVAPITKSEFYNGTVATPLGLYSHADQIMHWQTGIPHKRVATGWAGKISDMLNSCNSNTNISMCLSLSGSNVWQTGNQSTEFSISPYNGAASIHGDNDDWLVNSARKTALDNMLDHNYNDVFMDGYKSVLNTGRVGGEQLQTAIDAAPVWNEQFSNNYLSNSFKMVANTISGQNALGMDRQIFFIDYGGWDHHDELTNSQAFKLSEVDNALDEFNSAMEQLGLSDQVTVFGVSEFGRTLTSNGYGSDHGWGGNVFVMGGSVNGGNIYGDYPLLDLNGDLEIGGGVYIPTTAADEYFAELAMWFGVPNSELTTLFPNLGNFYSPGTGNPLGFLNL